MKEILLFALIVTILLGLFGSIIPRASAKIESDREKCKSKEGYYLQTRGVSGKCLKISQDLKISEIDLNSEQSVR